MKFSLEKMRALKYREKMEIQSLLSLASERLRPVISSPFSGQGNATFIIAEVKKGSPTLGQIRQVSSEDQADLYVTCGAGAVSVLCDKWFFQGDWEDIKLVAKEIEEPVLCKEFILFPEQIDLAHAYGADAVLLINKLLTPTELKYLYSYTRQIELTPLVEVHSPDELEHVLPLQPEYLMVNMRNLQTLSIDKKTAIQTLKRVPPGITKISASGIECADDIRRIKDNTGTHIFLIGTVLMKSQDPGSLLQEFKNVC